MCWRHSGDERTARRVGRISYDGADHTVKVQQADEEEEEVYTLLWTYLFERLQAWTSNGLPETMLYRSASSPAPLLCRDAHQHERHMMIPAAHPQQTLTGTLYRMLCQGMTIRVSGHLIFLDCAKNKQQQESFLQWCNKDLKMPPLPCQEIYVVWYNIINWHIWLNSY